MTSEEIFEYHKGLENSMDRLVAQNLIDTAKINLLEDKIKELQALIKRLSDEKMLLRHSKVELDKERLEVIDDRDRLLKENLYLHAECEKLNSKLEETYRNGNKEISKMENIVQNLRKENYNLASELSECESEVDTLAEQYHNTKCELTALQKSTVYFPPPTIQIVKIRKEYKIFRKKKQKTSRRVTNTKGFFSQLIKI